MSPHQGVVQQADDVDPGQGAVVDVAGDQDDVDGLVPDDGMTSWSMKARWASSIPTPWNDRPKCQSEVCNNRMLQN